MNTKKLPVGISDFKDIVSGDYYYIDKTLFIKNILDKGDKILLIPRPRRFGKTINISMLKYFFDCCPEKWSPGSPPPPTSKETSPQTQANRELFNSLAINKEDKKYMAKQGKFPVIFLSFKDVKEMDWETCFWKIKKLIRKEYARHYYLLQFQGLLPYEKEYFNMILQLKAERDDYESSLEMLLTLLSRYYDERVVILIDEYDAPIHAGFQHGYYEEITNFIRNFLSGGLKDTDKYLERGVITGILRIAKESFFSGLNNPGVYTLLAEAFNDKFGFTEAEVETLLKDFELLSMYKEVQKWYNGYRFGSCTIYNPWSIVNFMANEEKGCRPYWVNTSDNKIIDSLLSRGGKELRQELQWLLQGETIEKPIDENIVMNDIHRREDLLWSFLLMGGYLKQTAHRYDSFTTTFYYQLSIPNEEVRFTYIQIIKNYFSGKISNESLENMLSALIDGNIQRFEKTFKSVVTSVFSYHDFSGAPEKVYHAFVIGLLLWISGTHEIKSNRESGYGRYDILIIPHNPAGIGYIIEFKTVDTYDNETIESAVEAALKQIEEKKYETELVNRGIATIKKLAIVFSGKEVVVKEKGTTNECRGGK